LESSHLRIPDSKGPILAADSTKVRHLDIETAVDFVGQRAPVRMSRRAC
jgi:hypothetical protein